MTVRAGLALKIVSSLVKGLMPLRALVAGLRVVLPINEPKVVANAFVGTVVGSAADWLPLVRLKFPGLKLDFIPTSVFEGMLVQSIKGRSG